MWRSGKARGPEIIYETGKPSEVNQTPAKDVPSEKRPFYYNDTPKTRPWGPDNMPKGKW
jgi:hypothetical protein